MNQNPEQIARDKIDALLRASGWIIQGKKNINLNAGLGVAVREYQTDVGPADYVLFINRKPVGVIEAKKEDEGYRLIGVEEQSTDYATAKLKYCNNEMLPFVFESTGTITRFTNHLDPKPRGREIFSFYRPETLQEWLSKKSLRTKLHDLPDLSPVGLRDCQINAINNLEKSFKEAKPKALIQMATGSGKTFTAITFIYRLLKYSKAKRILFLVDTRNLGIQAEQEFMTYEPNDDNRKFTELYGVTLLKSSFIPDDSQVYISTIQRMYSILKGTELDESAEEKNPNEFMFGKDPLPVVYSEKIPPEYFDFIVIDECHRSIYNLWKQVLDYFDAFQVGLTATPEKRTFGYFNQNVVSDYGYEKAVVDGVLVPYNVFTIETKITKEGSKISFGENVDMRERLTRRKFWETIDEDVEYTGNQLDKDIVNPSQIRTVIRAFKENVPAMFPDRIDKNGDFEIPKTLIFAKTDSHAEDIIDIVREEFGEENRFCKKVTYRSEEDPKSVLSQFRNNYYPRIAVTVDMIATGTDIKPLEILLFMRDVRSSSYYEQMKGRGTRTIALDDLRKVTPSAKTTKDHFVIVDAIGVENSHKTDSRPLEKKPGMALKDILNNIAIGNNSSEELLSTLANRLIRLDKQINASEKSKFAELAEGKNISQVVKALLNAHDPDTKENIEKQVKEELIGESPDKIDAEIKKRHEELIDNSVIIFHSPELRDYIVDVRKKYDQIIDNINIDETTNIGWVKDHKEDAESKINAFKEWIEKNKDEITALELFYAQPYRRRELTYKMIKELYDKLILEQPTLAPFKIWEAYQKLQKSEGSPRNELTAMVSLVRKIAGLDETLTPFDKTVDQKFQKWIFKKNEGQHNRFSEEQISWLKMMKDYISNSFHIDREDFDLTPFNEYGGLGKMWQLFGEETEEIINELNEVLVA
ncbi:DEAD/DEAH box helicase family protein [Chryseobacterium suipulveris]|uniref:DEAD/DEAH box helicase family protein n=1 Tax=Chryseobacterium suipulveris TaxID=2929800 RepID=A0ABY4BR09_9FLAO|nr:DEAD/DEAH box helicase family protein [Chryseobacterium suipulveris]UOE41189.1 DEAD/DEAH box helicase family protein [Chryseobacterium suipulveris]